LKTKTLEIVLCHFYSLFAINNLWKVMWNNPFFRSMNRMNICLNIFSSPSPLLLHPLIFFRLCYGRFSFTKRLRGLDGCAAGEWLADWLTIELISLGWGKTKIKISNIIILVSLQIFWNGRFFRSKVGSRNL